MTFLEMLYNKPDLILLDSTDNLVRANLPHYKQFNPENLRQRLNKLFQALVKSVESGSCKDMIGFMKNVSDERYSSGFELNEVQTAINILEEALWKEVAKYVDSELQVAALKQITCILAKAKDELADEYALLSREYVS